MKPSVFYWLQTCFQTTWATFLYFSYLSCFRTLVLILNCSVFLSNLGFLLTVFSYTQDMKGEQLFCPLCHHFSRLGSLSLNWKGRLSINLIIIFTTSALLNIGPGTPYLNRQVSIIFPHLYLLIKLPFIKMWLFLISKSRTCIFFFPISLHFNCFKPQGRHFSNDMSSHISSQNVSKFCVSACSHFLFWRQSH